MLKSGHKISAQWHNMTFEQSTPCFLAAIILLIVTPVDQIVRAIITLAKPDYFKLNLNIDEDLANYFEALEASDKQSMILEEENMRNIYVRPTNSIINYHLFIII